jgi:hypothetical protein
MSLGIHSEVDLKRSSVGLLLEITLKLKAGLLNKGGPLF